MLTWRPRRRFRPRIVATAVWRNCARRWLREARARAVGRREWCRKHDAQLYSAGRYRTLEHDVRLRARGTAASLAASSDGPAAVGRATGCGRQRVLRDGRAVCAWRGVAVAGSPAQVALRSLSGAGAVLAVRAVCRRTGRRGVATAARAPAGRGGWRCWESVPFLRNVAQSANGCRCGGSGGLRLVESLRRPRLACVPAAVVGAVPGLAPAGSFCSLSARRALCSAVTSALP